MSTTEAVLDHHLQAVASGDLKGVLADYTEDSVLLTPNGPLKGLKALEEFFGAFGQNMPDFMDGFRMLRRDVLGDVAYIVWESPKYVLLGTDTFVVRNGRIVTQTFAAHLRA